MTVLPLVVSFYTQDTPYQLEVLSLINSCREWGIDCEIEGVICLGNWARNCARKPLFIRDKLHEKKRAIFWVDADAVFRKRPDFSVMMDSDISIREVPRFSRDPRLRYRAGSLFVNYTPGGIRFAEEWAARCQTRIDAGKDLTFMDQITLFELLETGVDARFFPLPLAFCKIFDLDADQIDENEVIVEHFQASRRFKAWSD